MLQLLLSSLLVSQSTFDGLLQLYFYCLLGRGVNKVSSILGFHLEPKMCLRRIIFFFTLGSYKRVEQSSQTIMASMTNVCIIHNATT